MREPEGPGGSFRQPPDRWYCGPAGCRQRGGSFLTPPWKLSAAQKIVDEILYQRFVAVLCLLGEHTRRLIDKDYVLILVHNVKGRLFYLLNFYLRKLFDGLLRQKQTDLVSLGKLFRTVALFSVEG